MHPNHPLAAWLTSSGIDPTMGGIASVTRSCLLALGGPMAARSEPVLAATRFLGLRSHDFSKVAETFPGIRFRACRGSRLRFLLENSGQVFARPSWVIHEHVDLAQCETLLPRSLRSRYAVWCHGIELWRELPSRKRQALREADLLLFNSSFTRKKAAEFHPWILECPYQVVPLCREGGSKANLLDTDASPSRKSEILTVGRLVEDRPKGHLEILASLPDLVAEIQNFHWHIVGDGPWRRELEDAVFNAGFAKQVSLHGFVDAERLNELYQTSRVFAMPSHGEGFGLVYAEAMAHGLPCIGSTLDAAPEVIKEGGMCVDLDDPEALPEALRRYLSMDEETFATASEQARKRSRFFEIDRFAGDFQAALLEDG